MANDTYNYSSGYPQQTPAAFSQSTPYAQPNPYAQANPYATPYGYAPGYPYPQPPDQQTHSGVGVASFIMGLLAGVAMLALIVIAGVTAANTPGGQLDENSPQAMTLGCAMLLAGGLTLVGAILGVIGLVQQGRRKVFSILGLVINGGMILFVLGLMALGAAAS